MRWSIIRLIWLRELRDQLRDRRTVFMIVGLPLILYPALGVIVLTFALQFFERPSTIGVPLPASGEHEFPARGDHAISPMGPAAIVAFGAEPGLPMATAVALTAAHVDYPPLLLGDRWCGPVAPLSKRDAKMVAKRFKIVWLPSDDKTALENGVVDIVLRADPKFYDGLDAEQNGPIVAVSPPKSDALGRPTITAVLRPGDDHSRQALQRLRPVLERWKEELKKVRFVRRGLDAEFDAPFALDEPKSASDASDPEKIADMVIRIFPFMLVMWSLAGALYPAVDLCAGEKERGTMETLLISPAGREEIVLGKFLTIWVFSTASALLNLLSMGLTTFQFSALLPHGTFPLGAIFWVIVLSLPLSALFSAISLAIGAYARSSKEGQYYLMPMFLVTMPLVFLTLAPGVELNPVYSLIPVTGVALLMQKLMLSPSLATVPWLYFIPVLAPVALYSALALRWAIDQFQREEVLFREAERIDIRLWLRQLLRDKGATATTGQAFFCFALLLLLRYFSLGFGANWEPLIDSAVNMLAFVTTPALMMALILSNRPLATLSLRRPPLRHLALAAVLAVLVVPPIVWTSHTLLHDYPQLQKLLESPRSFARDQAIVLGAMSHPWMSLLVFAVLPAIGEELAFRGLILTGLKKTYRPRTAVLLCSFLSALFHMNVFAFLPIFAISTVQGLLTLRSRSLAPAMLLHVVTKTVLLFSVPIGLSLGDNPYWPPLAAVCAATAFAIFWWLYRKPYIDEARRWA